MGKRHSASATAVVVAVITIIALLPGAAFAADPPITSTQSISIRIYDYAAIPADLLARSQKVVNRLYGQIGVRVEWAETISAASPARSLVPIDPREFVVVILSPRMSQQHALPDDVVGVAATAPAELGRLAYILYDRLERLDFPSDNQVMDAMGLVIAHELGHLLLPHGSHAVSGLMQPVWTFEMLRTDQGQFGFSNAQAEGIRRGLRR